MADPRFILDISRLLSRAGASVPTGIDRLELAYAAHLLSQGGKWRTSFIAFNPVGWIGDLPERKVSLFIAALCAGWNRGEAEGTRQAAHLARSLLRDVLFDARSLAGFASHTGRKKADNAPDAVYLLLSHHHLMRYRTLRHHVHSCNAVFVPMVHDLIPIDFPEYSRPREPARHKARMATVARLSHGVLVPSLAVKESLEHYLAGYYQETGFRKDFPVWVVPHGVHIPPRQGDSHPVISHRSEDGEAGHPYFVMLGTIEPRKNHLLLLNLWREMVEQKGGEVPHLVLVGKRGWENENILDMLERCPALRGVVREENNLSDEDVARLLTGSHGLLFPSFSEGYGLPLAEAMALGVPAIVADIPVLREVGRNIAHYVNPLDAPGWKTAIEDFAIHGSLWQRQKEALTRWKSLSWTESVSLGLSHCLSLLP